MAWIRSLKFKGKTFNVGSLHAFGEHSLDLTRDDIETLGDDLPDVIDWFMSDDGKEWCLVQDWQYANYGHQFFTAEERERIYNSRFATEQDKQFCFYDKRTEPAEKREPRPKTKKPGYVYLIRAENGYYKIGRAKNYQERIERLEVKLPFSIEPLHILQCVDMVEAERALHIRFQDKRVNGEWFALTPEDVEYIKNMSA